MCRRSLTLATLLGACAPLPSSSPPAPPVSEPGTNPLAPRLRSHVVVEDGAVLTTAAGQTLRLPPSSGQGWTFRVVGTDGDRVELATHVGFAPCEPAVPWFGNDDIFGGKLDVRFFVDREALLEVLGHELALDFEDGTAARLAPGSVVRSGGGGTVVDAAGVVVRVPVAEAAVGISFEPNETFATYDVAGSLGLDVPLAVGGHPVSGTEALERVGMPVPGDDDGPPQDHYALTRIDALDPDRARVKVRGRCAVLTVVVPAAQAETIDLGGMLGLGGFGQPPGRPLRIPEGTELRWTDGSFAGVVVAGSVDVADAPGDPLCFETPWARPELELPALCVSRSAVTAAN